MQVEEGKFYRNGNGSVVGPMRRMAVAMAIESDGLVYEYEGVSSASGEEYSYTSDGLFSSMRDGPLRLIEECAPETPNATTARAIEEGDDILARNAAFMSEPITASLTAEPDRSWEAEEVHINTGMTEEELKAHEAGAYKTDETFKPSPGFRTSEVCGGKTAAEWEAEIRRDQIDKIVNPPITVRKVSNDFAPGQLLETEDGRLLSIADTRGQPYAARDPDFDEVDEAPTTEPVIASINIVMRGNTPATREWMLSQLVKLIVSSSMDLKTCDVADEGDHADIVLSRR